MPFYGLSERTKEQYHADTRVTSSVHLWTAQAKGTVGKRPQKGSSGGEAYRHRGTWDWCRLCHSGHCSWQCRRHTCSNTGDICTVTLGAHHLSLVTGSWWRVCGYVKEISCTCFYHHRFPRTTPCPPWLTQSIFTSSTRHFYSPWFELMLEVTVVAVCVVPVSWVSQGGLEHTLCAGKEASNVAPAWDVTVGTATTSKPDSRVP